MYSRGGMSHATPAASEGVLDTRGIVPPAIPRYFFHCPLPFKPQLKPLIYFPNRYNFTLIDKDARLL
jgi:hypothetical protein